MKYRITLLRKTFAVVILIFFLTFGILFLPSKTRGLHTNISSDSGEHWAWNDIINWIDFHGDATVNVDASGLTGYASSSVGDISLDCLTARGGSVCGRSNYKVLNNGGGLLSGWGWNDAVGWISFCGGPANSCPGLINYRVSINTPSGDFAYYAWNDVVGWISFNCDNHGCPPQYEVRTSWIPASAEGVLDSSIFDTGIIQGAQINSIAWKGNMPAGTAAQFQIATSNSESGPWNFIGPDGTATSYYSYDNKRNINLTTDEFIVKINYELHSNQRYLRYRVVLRSDLAQENTPRVDEIIINWSP